MPKYVIEREIPRAAELFSTQGRELSEKANPKPREPADKGGFPITRVSEARRMIDPTTGAR
jgi:hypothetical protein